MASSSGSATAAPRPLRKVRRGNEIFETYIGPRICLSDSGLSHRGTETPRRQRVVIIPDVPVPIRRWPAQQAEGLCRARRFATPVESAAASLWLCGSVANDVTGHDTLFLI